MTATTDLPPELLRLGEQLERAVARDLDSDPAPFPLDDRASRWRWTAVAAAAAAVVLLVGIGALAAGRGDDAGGRPAPVATAGPSPSTGDLSPTTAPDVATTDPTMSAEEVADTLRMRFDRFAGTDPTCQTDDGRRFSCHLVVPPAGDPAGEGVQFLVYDGDTRVVVGACRSDDAEGRVWRCALGALAVEDGLLDLSDLGQPPPPDGDG